MTVWEIIGIECTMDEAKIKRAYSAQLKLHRPDEDPEGFQTLRTAYDAALAQIKSPDLPAAIRFENDIEANSPVQVLQGTVPEQREGKSLKTMPEQWEPESDKLPQKKIDEFISQTISLYDDFPERIKLSRWDELLESEVLWDVGLHEQISEQMLEVLWARHHLPRCIWELLENKFHWVKEGIILENRLLILIRYIDMQLNFGLTLTQYGRLNPIDADIYLTDLELLTPMHERFGAAECGRLANKLKTQYPYGDEVYILEQLYYRYYIQDLTIRAEGYLPENPERRLSIVNQFLEIAPCDQAFLRLRIIMYFSTNQLSLAKADFEVLLETCTTYQQNEDLMKWYCELIEKHRIAGDTHAKHLLRSMVNSQYSLWILLGIIGGSIKYIDRLKSVAMMVFLGVLIGSYVFLKIWLKKH